MNSPVNNRMNNLGNYPLARMRRLRYHPKVRKMLVEQEVKRQDLILPLFIAEGKGIRNPIRSMPGHYQLSVDQLEREVNEILNLKISAVILFGLPEVKDEYGSSAVTVNNIISRAIQRIKEWAPELLVISDLCFCEYTSHGHCGVLYQKNQMLEVDNDRTVEFLMKQAVEHAKAGADIVAPSSMMDGMVAGIRRGLDQQGFNEIPILSYAIKFASSLYGPFREAAQGAPQFGNRASYQMDPANTSQALREAELDVAEGADMLMVKPASSYLDIVYQIKHHFPTIPLGAYQVSGEFAMIKAAAQLGWLDEQAVMMESLLSIKRAGANFIISYYAKEAARFIASLNEESC